MLFLRGVRSPIGRATTAFLLVAVCFLAAATATAAPAGRVVVYGAASGSHLSIGSSGGDLFVDGFMARRRPVGCHFSGGRGGAVCPLAGVSRVEVEMGDSGDLVEVTNRLPLPLTVFLHGGEDKFIGNGERDTCYPGGTRRNRCVGGGGDDICISGPRNTDCVGGPGDDYCRTSTGSDGCWGGPGRDVCYMGPGQDGCHGGPGDDRLFGGPGADQLYGGPGHDYCDGGPGLGKAHNCEAGDGRGGERAARASSGAGLWLPSPTTRPWQWQLQGRIDTGIAAPVYDVDGFETSAATVAALHRLGRRVICYLDVGSWESYRPDAGEFPRSVIGRRYEGFPDERWLDVRRFRSFAPELEKRFATCARKGFDAVEPDNLAGWENKTGFPISKAAQLRFNRWVARRVHARGMSVALKNDGPQAAQLVGDFDFAIVEECFHYEECGSYRTFIRQGKAVFEAEYESQPSEYCDKARAIEFSAIRKSYDLFAQPWLPCPQ